MRRSIGLTVVIGIAATLISATPAAAQTDGIYDRQGDAPAFLDVTSLEVHNRGDDLLVKAIVPGFDPTRLDYPLRPLPDGDDWGSLFLYVQVRGVDGRSWTPTWRSTLGHFVVAVGPGGATNPVDDILLSRQRGSTSADVPCAGLDAEVSTGMVSATIPQSCFRRVTGKGAGAVRVKAVMSGNVGPRSTDDRTSTTPWVSRASK